MCGEQGLGELTELGELVGERRGEGCSCTMGFARCVRMWARLGAVGQRIAPQGSSSLLQIAAAELRNSCRRSGVQIGIIDAVIAQ